MIEIARVASIVSEKATEIAFQEIKKFKMEHLDVEIDDSMRNVTVQRSISQLTFQISRFHVAPDASDEDISEAFESWFSEQEEEDLRRACQHCLSDQVSKLKKDNDENLSFLERYLRDHKRR